MATTGRVIEFLLAGAVNPNTGAAIASGKARFYQPGTLVAQNVYSDDACTTAITPPFTLGSGGEAKLFALEPVRVIIKDSSDTTTLIDTVNVTRAEQVYLTNTNWNSGAETDMDQFVTDVATNLGADGKYKESAGATARAYGAWLREYHVSAEDFATDGGGTLDDAPELQSAIDQAIDNGAKRLFLPAGTYRIDTALSIDTAGFELYGAGRGRTIIRNHSTSGNAITITLSGSADAKVYIHDLSITANTTSSGKGIVSTNGDRVVVERVSTALHRTGIDFSAVSGCKVADCVIESTDDNASAIGITGGARGRVDDCEVISGTDNGSGMVLGADGRARGCYVSNFATGFLLSGARSLADGCHVTGATTGASLTGADSRIVGSYVTSCTTGASLGAARTGTLESTYTSCTTGVSVGAFASCRVIGNAGSGNTTDLSVNASATLLEEYGNPTFTVLSDSATTPHSWLKDRGKVQRIVKTTTAGASPSITPTPSVADIHVFSLTDNTAGQTVTINATSTTGLVDGQKFVLVLSYRGSGTITSFNPNSQYIHPFSISGITNTSYSTFHYVWRASSSKWLLVDTHSGTASIASDHW